MSTLMIAGDNNLTSFSRILLWLWNSLITKVLLPIYFVYLVATTTIQQHKQTIIDVKDLIENGDYVGYQKGSYVPRLLKKWNFDDSKLKIYNSPKEYNEALMKGSKNGGVTAIFDELPYIELFLKIYCDRYTSIDTTHRMDGFGFVFPRGSTLVADVSRALLSALEEGKIEPIEKKWFGHQSTCTDSPGIFSLLKVPLLIIGIIILVLIIYAMVSRVRR